MAKSTGPTPGAKDATTPSARGAASTNAKGAVTPGAKGAGSSGATGASDDAGTAVRPAFASRVKETISKAAKEHSDTISLSSPKSGTKKPRRARLRLTRVDPVSVMKTSFLLSVAFGVVTFVAVLIVWTILGAAGLWDAVNDTVATVVTSGDQASTFDIRDYVGMGRVLGFTLVVAVIDVILLTAIATLVAFLYNMSAALLGGIEVTLAED